MSTALFDLADFAETRVDWVPIYKPFGLTLLSLITQDRCRDCGAIGGNGEHCAQGSQPGVGRFALCDECVPLDPRWGVHTGDRVRAEAAREQRRATYLRKKKS